MDRMRKRKLVVFGESFYGKSLHEHLLGRNVCLLTFQFRVTVLLPQPPDFLRILGERRQSEARLRRELGRARGEECSSRRAHSRPFTLLPSRWTRASLSSSFRLSSPKIRKKITLVLHAIVPITVVTLRDDRLSRSPETIASRKKRRTRTRTSVSACK